MSLAVALAALVGLGGCSELENEPKKPFVRGAPSLVAGQFNTTEFILEDNRARYMRTGINGSSSGGHQDWFSYNDTKEAHGFIRGFTYRFTPERWLGERANKRQVGDRTSNGDMILMADPGSNNISLSLRAAPNNTTEEEFNSFQPDLTLGPYRCLEYSVGYDKNGAEMAFPEVWSMEATFNPDGTGAYTYLNDSGLLEQNRSPRPFNYIRGSAAIGGIGALLISDASARQANPLEPTQPILSPGPNLDENYFADVVADTFRIDCGDDYLIDPRDDAGEGNGLERRVEARPQYCNVAAYGAANVDGSVLFASRQFYEAVANRPRGVVETIYSAPSGGLRDFQSQQICVRASAGKSDASLAGAWWQMETYVDDGVAVTTFAELILNDQGIGESRQIDVAGNVAPRTAEVQFFVDSNGVLNFGGGLGAVNGDDSFFIYNASDDTGKRGMGFAIRQNLPPDDLAERIGETPDEE
ncbi:hypothetical protein [Allohahella marinimesophila]|uniref:Beta/gamma crystallin n=1 Tax=Allohahella marinimesophila TaxID=1054972 RepID=A0ABP7PMC3_9GAMM